MENWLHWMISAIYFVVTTVLEAALLIIGAGVIGTLYYLITVVGVANLSLVDFAGIIFFFWRRRV
jgi:hypothetical protein